MRLNRKLNLSLTGSLARAAPADNGGAARHDCNGGGLSEQAAAPALSTMEQLFGAPCARTPEFRVNKEGELRKQR